MRQCIHREAIARLAECGEKSSVIGRKLDVPLRTVQKIVKQWNSTGSVETKKKEGRPRSVNTRRIRSVIKKRITRNDGVSMNSIAQSLGIARRTVQTIVKDSLGLRSYRLGKGQFLSDAAKMKRWRNCKKLLQTLRVRRVSDILWSDEKIFTLEKAHNS